jgi:hypothetical protein
VRLGWQAAFEFVYVENKESLKSESLLFLSDVVSFDFQFTTQKF